MRKAGTYTAALGFIYLGIWILFRNSNIQFANEIFKWWPILIILLGVEILFYYSSKQVERKTGFNGLVILVILIFAGLNTTQVVGERFGLGLNWLGDNINISNGIDFLSGINDNNYRVITTSAELDSNGKSINLGMNNAEVKVMKSTDSKIKIQADIYVNKNSGQERYDLRTNKQTDGYSVNIDDSYIKKSVIIISLPEKMSLKVNSNNLKITSEGIFDDINYIVQANNGMVEISGANSLDLDINNGTVKISDVKKINVKGNNGSFNFDGNCEDIYLRANNGSLSINNKLTKNVDVSMNLGTIKFTTEEKNLSIDATINHGAIDINGSKNINSPASAITGNGEGKAKIHVDNGTITVRNQE